MQSHRLLKSELMHGYIYRTLATGVCRCALVWVLLAGPAHTEVRQETVVYDSAIYVDDTQTEPDMVSVLQRKAAYKTSESEEQAPHRSASLIEGNAVINSGRGTANTGNELENVGSGDESVSELGAYNTAFGKQDTYRVLHRMVTVYPKATCIGLAIAFMLVHFSFRLTRFPEGKGGTRTPLGFLADALNTPDADARQFIFFTLWDTVALGCFILSLLNVKWHTTNLITGIFVIMIQGIMHWFVLEIPALTIAMFFTTVAPLHREGGDHLTLILNYNLLATSEQDIDECMQNMFDAFMGNLDSKVSAVLVSASNEPELQEYELQTRDRLRNKIYQDLHNEGMVWAGLAEGEVPVEPSRERRVWNCYQHLDAIQFLQALPAICESFSREFMVVHRVSRVLRKCGQYQDLMLLSEGYKNAFTYCSTQLYGKAARRDGEPLFHQSKDVENVCGRHFDYTLVLDSDTLVAPGLVTNLLQVAAGNPEREIIQPAIRFHCTSKDPIFAHVEALRQSIFTPMTHVQTTICNRSPFFGKGLIRNSAYVNKCIGTPEHPLELVPIDVLSHDTFEAAVTTPLYVPDIFLLEAPCSNYATWSTRELRWNRGELILAMHFWPATVGRCFRWFERTLQKDLQQNPRSSARTRLTVANLDKASSYTAHAALRTMSMKIMLVLYIVVVDIVDMYYQKLPLVIVMFLLIVFPKFAVCSRHNYDSAFVETIASILQFTPEAVIGSVRVIRALHGLLVGNVTWTPQRKVEEEFRSSNAWAHAVRYLWRYWIFALITTILVVQFRPSAICATFTLGSLLMLPLYVGITSHQRNAWSLRRQQAPPKWNPTEAQ